MMKTSQILKFADFTKTQKSRYLDNERFFLQIKKLIKNHKKNCKIFFVRICLVLLISHAKV